MHWIFQGDKGDKGGIWMKEIFEAALRAMEEGTPAALVILTRAKGSTPRKPGAMMLVLGDGRMVGTVGGGVMEKRLREEALRAIEREETIYLDFELSERDRDKLGLYCGGVVEFSIVPVLPKEKLIIFGGGHVSKALVPLASRLGFRVTVVDDRKEYAVKEAFRGAKDVILSDYSEFARKLETDDKTYILIATQTHDSDFEVLKIILEKDFKYLGMLGSKTKLETFKKRMDEKLKKRMDKLRTPVGLDIGAETPDEIARSIMAELIDVRRKG